MLKIVRPLEERELELPDTLTVLVPPSAPDSRTEASDLMRLSNEYSEAAKDALYALGASIRVSYEYGLPPRLFVEWKADEQEQKTDPQPKLILEVFGDKRRGYQTYRTGENPEETTYGGRATAELNTAEVWESIMKEYQAVKLNAVTSDALLFSLPQRSTVEISTDNLSRDEDKVVWECTVNGLPAGEEGILQASHDFCAVSREIVGPYIEQIGDSQVDGGIKELVIHVAGIKTGDDEYDSYFSTLIADRCAVGVGRIIGRDLECVAELL